MTIERFKELVENHDDIMMHCGKFKFTIMTCYDQIYVGEQNARNGRYYDTADDILDRFPTDGKTLRDRIKEVELDSCS